MPRQARLDAPGTLHHVILRGLERGRILRDDTDRQAFVTRLADVVQATGATVYAWALLPNHAHLLLRSGRAGLPTAMRRLLTGYAGTFNRRHRRIGHVFHNRYKSIVVEEDRYFRELVRYIHLNPLRAGLVPNLGALTRYPWGGHAGLLGRVPQPWLAASDVLRWFGRPPRQARQAYSRYVAEGVALGRRPELVGGGLVRSAGGWAVVQAWRRRGEATTADPRILGTGEFVERVVAEADPRHRPTPRGRRPEAIARVIRTACKEAGIGEGELRTGSRRRAVARLRGVVAQRLVTTFGLSLADAAWELGVSTSAICRVVRKAGGQ